MWLYADLVARVSAWVMQRLASGTLKAFWSADARHVEPLPPRCRKIAVVGGVCSGAASSAQGAPGFGADSAKCDADEDELAAANFCDDGGEERANS